MNSMLSASKREFIQFMMSADVLRFGKFKTKSGRLTPYFVNTGNYKTGAQISTLGKFYADLIQNTLSSDGFDALFGPAYKGIPLVTAAAGSLARDYGIDKPYFFNRKEEKDHGEGGSFIGYCPKDGDRLVIIEDVITAGTAVREVLPLLKGCADVSVPHMFISVDRCEVGQDPSKTTVMEVREQFDIQVHAILSVFDIYEYLKQEPSYTQILKDMEHYMEQYCRF